MFLSSNHHQNCLYYKLNLTSPKVKNSVELFSLTSFKATKSWVAKSLMVCQQASSGSKVDIKGKLWYTLIINMRCIGLYIDIKYALGGEPGPRAVLLRPPPLWYTFLDPPWTAPESVSIIYCHHHKPFEEPPWTAPILIIVVVIKIVIVVVSSLSSSRSPISTLSSIPSYPDWLGWQSWPPLDTFLSPGFTIKDCPRTERRSQQTTVTCLIVKPPSSTLRKSSDAARGTWKHIYW